MSPRPTRTRFPRLDYDPAPVNTAITTYWAASAVAGAVWIAVLVRSRSPAWRAVAWWPLLLSAAGYLVALFARPSLSIDILSYLSHGYLAATPGVNPYLLASGDVMGLPPGPALAAEGWSAVHGPTPYGPLWTHLERLGYLASGGDIGTGLLLLKGVAVGCCLVSGVLIWLIARRIRPGTELAATLGFAWCPVIVVHFGLDGHNDALAVALTLLAVWAAGSGRAWLVVLALGLGGLTKFTPLIFAPPLLVLLVRGSTSRLRALMEILAGAAAVGLIGWLLWRPWWIGSATLDGLRASTTPFPGPGPAGMLAGWLADPASDPMTTEVDLRAQLILSAVLLAVVLALSWRRTFAGAVTACAVIALAAVALLPAYWPWYAGMAIALLSLRPSWVTSAQLVLLSAGAVITAPLGDLAALGLVPFEDMFASALFWGVSVPVAGCALLGVLALILRPSVGCVQGV